MADETRHGWLLRGSADAYSAAPYVDFSTWDGVVPRIRQEVFSGFGVFQFLEGFCFRVGTNVSNCHISRAMLFYQFNAI